jgi:phage baseplate assembly protein V
MSWGDLKDIASRTRNMIRRGYLVKTYTDGMLMQARVKTGDGIENDKIDVMHPAGFSSHWPAGNKTEVITADVNGDASKRVVLAVIGDRAKHPKAAAGEAMLYSPDDPKKRISASKTGGISMEADDAPISMKTDKGIKMEAKEGANLLDGAIEIDAEGNVTFKGNLTIGKNLTVKGNITVVGTVTAADFITA